MFSICIYTAGSITVYKITKLSQYIAFTGLSILASAIIPVSAATITFDLDFFDDSGTEVGNGEFSYDDEETLTCLQITDSFECGIEPTEEEIDIYGEPTVISNALTDFSANIDGIDWNYGDAYLTWWSDDSTGQPPGQISVSRNGSFPEDNYWFFGDGFFGIEQFYMDFDRSSDTFGEGNWGQSIVEPVSELPFADSGIWQATRVGTGSESSVPAPSPSEAVPESSTIFGTLVAMIFGYLSRRKFARTKA